MDVNIFRNEGKFEKVFQANPDGIAISRIKDNMILEVNKAMLKILGYQREEVLGMNVMDLRVWENITDRETYIAALKETEEVYDRETVFCSRAGRQIPVSLSGRLLEIEGDACIITIVRDITYTKLMEEALKASEEKYRSTIDSINDSIYVVNDELRIILHNSVFAAGLEGLKDLGIEPVNVIGKTLTEAFPYVSSKLFDKYNTVIETGQALNTEESVAIGGREYVVDVRRIPLFEGGKVTRIVTISRDITERKKQEEALRESEIKYRSLANNVPDIVCSVNKDGYIIAVNDITHKILGYSSDEIIGKPFMQFIYHDDLEMVLRTFRDGINERREYTKSLQFRVIAKNDKALWMELNSHKTFNKDGSLYQMDSVLRDITERRIIEEEKAILAKRLAERTEELSRANYELARAIKAKDEFLASMSHELRTPLSAILNISESLDEEIYGPINPKQRSSLKNITESGQHLLSLINDILDLSKIEAGKITLNLNPVPVEDICQASFRLIKTQALKKKLSTTLTVDSQVTSIMADERYLKQMLVNLLSNAVKFTPDEGKIGLEIKGCPETETAEFTVWDTGIGIPEEQITRLFKPFTQLDSSLSRKYEGTGLGLALVAKLAEVHGGSVSLDCSQCEGSRFTIKLPWTAKISVDDIRKTDSRVSEFSAPIKHALIVEDSIGDAEQISRYLNELGITSVIHKEGREVVEKAIDVNPDVIILDIILPDIDGWEVLSRLKSNEKTKHMPVIISSVIDDRNHGLKVGASEYLVKPFSRHELRKVLNNALKKPDRESMALVITAIHESLGRKDESGGPLVLLAEDNETTINNVSDYLTAHGYRVIVARNGDEALKSAGKFKPSIILMDIQMPIMDGLEAMHLIKADINISHIPIIALTAIAMPGDRERCIEAGADDYLSKPLSLKKLIQSMEDLRKRTGNSVK